MADTADISSLDQPSSVNLFPLMLDLPGYGYVLLTVVLTWFLLFWQGFMVGRARKKYKVEYPNMYSDTEPIFNCYQRVHQNTLERVTVFLTILLAAGLLNPKMAAAFGFLWVIGRIIYSIGYYSGKPQNRLAGAMLGMFLGEMPLVIMTFLQVGQFAQWWNIPQLF
jgi:glutathione S-transferase